MSRLGKKSINIPDKTDVIIKDGVITVSGPHGTLTEKIHPKIDIKVNDGEINILPVESSIEANALWGTFASLVRNMVDGVNNLYEKKLSVEGVGFKVDMQGKDLIFALGFSHPVKVAVPEDLNVSTEKNVISISGISKHAVGQFAANIRALKKPEPYKGKGIRYVGENVRRKEGKKTA